MANDGYREKKEGPISFMFLGKSHIGNIIKPTLGGNSVKAQKFTAISRLWGRKSTHDSQHAAREWLKVFHGNSMRLESTDNNSTHDVLRERGWKKAQPYGFKHQVMANERVKYSHPDLPGHHITAAYHDSSWQHHTGGRESPPVHSGTKSLQTLLTKLHGSKQESAIKDFVHLMRDEYPNDWREVILESFTQEGADVQGATQHSTMQRAVKHSRLAIVKKDPTQAVYGPDVDSVKEEIKEELFDKDKNLKDPKAGPPIPDKKEGKKSKLSIVSKDPTKDKQGPKPKPTEDGGAEAELTIGTTKTGQPGSTIDINPVIKPMPAGGDRYNQNPEVRKKPIT